MIPKTWIKILTDELRKTGHSKEIAKCRANTFYQDLMNYINAWPRDAPEFDEDEWEETDPHGVMRDLIRENYKIEKGCEDHYSLECLISIIHHSDQVLESDLVHTNHRSQRLDPCGKIPLFETWYDIFYL